MSIDLLPFAHMVLISTVSAGRDATGLRPAMEEIKLMCIGAGCTAALALCQARFAAGLSRLAGNLVVVAASALVVDLLHLSLIQDPNDLLSVDVGVIVVAGIWSVGGLLPPSLLKR